MPLTHQELRQRAADSHAKAAADAKALLEAANSASQIVAVLHVAFMAVCAYVLVIVFGTTDLDLLMGGNNVKLPVIDVMVPIVGFYAFAPLPFVKEFIAALAAALKAHRPLGQRSQPLRRR